MELKLTTFTESILDESWIIGLPGMGVTAYEYNIVDKKRIPVLDDEGNKIVRWELKDVRAEISFENCKGDHVIKFLRRALKVELQKRRNTMTADEFKAWIEHPIFADTLAVRVGVTTLEKAEALITNLPDDQYLATIKKQLMGRGRTEKEAETFIAQL